MCSAIASSSRPPPSIASRRQITTKSAWVAKNSMPARDQRRDAVEARPARPTRRGDVMSAQSSIACSITAAYSRSLDLKW